MKAINQRLAIAQHIVNDETPMAVDGDYRIGVDLGTADVVTMVVDRNGWPLACFLDWANVVRDGVVVDYYGASQIVKKQLAKVAAKLSIDISRVSTSYPPGTDPRISTNVIESAGVVIDHVVDEPSAVAAFFNIAKGAVVDIGGGTTGTAIVRDGKVIESADDATGGTHLTLTIAGSKSISIDDAELLKRSDDNAQYLSIVRPVIEKMTDIVAKHIDKHAVDNVYLTGGTCCFPELDKIFAANLAVKNVILPDYPLYLTPLAIACCDLDAAAVTTVDEAKYQVLLSQPKQQSQHKNTVNQHSVALGQGGDAAKQKTMVQTPTEVIKNCLVEENIIPLSQRFNAQANLSTRSPAEK